jgi:hypothetical protein
MPVESRPRHCAQPRISPPVAVNDEKHTNGSLATMTSSESSVTVSWEDIAVVVQEDDDLVRSFSTAMEIRFAELPAIVASSDDSCSSDSMDSNCSYDESNQTQVSELVDVRLSKGNRVRFSSVYVREYSVDIGDHPNVEMYPITLDWAFVESDPQGMDEFESGKSPTTGVKQQQRQQQQYKRGESRAPRLTATERMARLADVTGRSNQQLYQQERQRQLIVREEKRLAAVGLPRAFV